MTSFYDLPLSDEVLDALWDMRFETCTPIQEQCIPLLLEGRDLIGIAQTGTGKTAAYLLPLLSLLQRESHPADAVNCLIMAPTRELAQQIDQALQGFAYYTNINGVAVYGGNDGIRFEQERRSFDKGADIVIATPGRLITHMQLGNLDLSRTTHIILDEADRMLDMGFYDDIMTIIKALPRERQTVLFSATMPEEIAKMAREVMIDPAEVRIAVSKPAEKIDQSVYVCREGDKTYILKEIFAKRKPERVIVFASSKQKVKELNISLRQRGYNAEAMHSDLEQRQRDEVMLAFKQRKVDILVATDIVSRGIDIDDITMVVNFDCPRDPEDYVHRIGRTARAGRAGCAVTLVGEKDQYALGKIERLLDAKIPRNALPDGLREPEMGEGHGRGGRVKDSHIGRGKNQRGRGRGRGGKSRQGQRADAAAAPTTSSTATADATSADTPQPRKRTHRGGRHRGKSKKSAPCTTSPDSSAPTSSAPSTPQ